MTRGSSGLAAAALLLTSAPALAQTSIATDGSLGAQVDIPEQGGVYEISDTLGRYMGDNLFQSFDHFLLGSGDIASFLAENGAPARVIARVTGGSGTQVDGTLRSVTDLFLLDGHGVSFGPDARLEVDGSFYASTADALRFTTGSDFLTGDASPDPLLSAAPPAAFGFTSSNLAQVQVVGDPGSPGLSVPPGETLSLVGGDGTVGEPGVSLVGDSRSTTRVIDAPGAHLEIASVAGPIDVPVALADFDLEGADPAALGNVDIRSAVVDLSGTATVPAGSVMIRGGEFLLVGGSQILAENNAAAAAVGDIDIAVSGDLFLVGTGTDGGRQTLIQSWTRGGGAAGDILLSGDRVLIDGGALIALTNGGSPGHLGRAPDAMIQGRVVEITEAGLIQAQALSAGSASRIGIVASEQIAIDAGGVVSAELFAGHSGTPGGISLAAPEVVLERGGLLSDNAGAPVGPPIGIDAYHLVLSDSAILADDGGSIGIVADHVEVSDSSAIANYDVVSAADDTSGVSGGDVEIGADLLQVSGASGILAKDGGSIGIEADIVEVSDSFVVAEDGGSVGISADLVELLAGGQVITRSIDDAPAGTISVVADTIVASGRNAEGLKSGLVARARETASPTETAISIDARILEVTNGAEISASTEGAADAGSVEILDAERVTVQGGQNGFSLISASALGGSTGNGGAVVIDTGVLELLEGGEVSTTTFGSGDAGRIDVTADTIEISGVDPGTGQNEAALFSRADPDGGVAGGNGGSVSLTATAWVDISDHGTVNTETTGAGRAGDIDITAGQWVGISSQGVVSTESSGAGLAGDIDIDGGGRIDIEQATVTAQAGFSGGGNIELSADELVYLLDSQVEADVLGGAGGGGDVTLDAELTVTNRSSLTARAEAGPGGNLLIVTDYFIPSGDSERDFTSRFGVDGTVVVTGPEADVTGGLAVLPAEYLDASALLERDCAARTERAGSFTVQPRRRLAPPPDALTPPPEAGSCEEDTP